MLKRFIKCRLLGLWLIKYYYPNKKDEIHFHGRMVHKVYDDVFPEGNIERIKSITRWNKEWKDYETVFLLSRRVPPNGLWTDDESPVNYPPGFGKI